ncbi:MAG: NAD-dependent epimerase/dehydratase family protein [Bryobacteraceae bacterium]
MPGRIRIPFQQSMDILVIGGTLFIGRLLVNELLKAGHNVTGITSPFCIGGQSTISDGGWPIFGPTAMTSPL